MFSISQFVVQEVETTQNLKYHIILRAFFHSNAWFKYLQWSCHLIALSILFNSIFANSFQICVCFNWYFKLQSLFRKMNRKLSLLFSLSSNFIMSNFLDDAFAKFNFFLRYSMIKSNAINFFVQQICFALNFFVDIK